MPLSSTTLHQALCAGMPSLDPATASEVWVTALSAYASTSVPGAASPAMVNTLMKSTVGSGILSLAPMAFAQVLESSLVSFWSQFIPAALPGQAVVLATPTLANPLSSAMALAQGCLTKPEAMLPIANAIDVWTKTIVYGPVGSPPATPLV